LCGEYDAGAWRGHSGTLGWGGSQRGNVPNTVIGPQMPANLTLYSLVVYKRPFNTHSAACWDGTRDTAKAGVCHAPCRRAWWPWLAGSASGTRRDTGIRGHALMGRVCCLCPVGMPHHQALPAQHACIHLGTAAQCRRRPQQCHLGVPCVESAQPSRQFHFRFKGSIAARVQTPRTGMPRRSTSTF
jgi:hypothetical protein